MPEKDLRSISDNFISEASDTITLKSALLEKNISAIGKWPDDSFFAKKDSSLKKNTAFVKKVRNFLDSQKDALLAEFESLNLSKYVEEVATAIVEAKIKTTDIPFILKLCSAMHQRYSDFGSLISDAWKKVLSTK
ncbi:Regulator of nonsense transcripts 2 [Fasciola gigantica]|uniref:Regulator of nonsense transcripts 2 n=1 Tax=Fasciola gigantica TaxID=46835 RepID=A0A504XRX7_FASGI|nr:Regulator of nonsense transcripts 2 [Fasciola gigantica]